MNPQTRERAVRFASQFGILHLASAVWHRLHVFTTTRQPHDWPAEAPCCAGDHGVLGLIPDLPPKSAPDARCHHSKVSRRTFERRGQLCLNAVRLLSGGPNPKPAVQRAGSCDPVCFHRSDLHTLVDIASTNDDVRDLRQIDR
jgi:hypothetical protein